MKAKDKKQLNESIQMLIIAVDHMTLSLHKATQALGEISKGLELHKKLSPHENIDPVVDLRKVYLDLRSLTDRLKTENPSHIKQTPCSPPPPEGGHKEPINPTYIDKASKEELINFIDIESGFNHEYLASLSIYTIDDVKTLHIDILRDIAHLFFKGHDKRRKERGSSTLDEKNISSDLSIYSNIELEDWLCKYSYLSPERIALMSVEDKRKTIIKRQFI